MGHMATQLKQAFVKTLKLALAVGLITWLIREGAIDFSVLKRLASPMGIVIGGALVLVMIFVNNFRWLMLLRTQGFSTNIRKTLPLSFIGIFFNYAMPGGVGGDVVKGYYLLQDHPEKKMAGAMSIVMDRLLGLFMMITTAAAALLTSWELVIQSPQLQALALLIFALFSGFLAFFIAALSRRFGGSPAARLIFEKLPGGKLLQKVHSVLHSYRQNPMALFTAMGLSLISQFSVIIFIYLVARALELPGVPFIAYCFIVPVGLVTTSIPISPAGIGVGQVAFGFLFGLYLGQATELTKMVGATGVTAWQIVQFFWGLVGAFFYLNRGKPKSFD